MLIFTPMHWNSGNAVYIKYDYSLYDNDNYWHGCIADRYPCSSCKEILERNEDAPSGEYSIKTSRGQTLKNVR